MDVTSGHSDNGSTSACQVESLLGSIPSARSHGGSIVKYKKSFIGITVILLTLVGCASSLMSRYDKETHQNMAYLKPMIEDTYLMYQRIEVDVAYLNKVNNAFRRILSYEKSKGTPNADTVKQIEIVYNMFDRHAKERIAQGMWPKAHAENKLKNIQKAIDLVIESELSKNK